MLTFEHGKGIQSWERKMTVEEENGKKGLGLSYM